MDEVDKKILNEIQSRFPLNIRPFKIIGERIGINEEEVIKRVKGFQESGLIRRTGAIFDSHSLGWESTLVALKISESDVDNVAMRINEKIGVTHNYHRNHKFNLWFTISAPTKDELEREIIEIISYPEVKEYLILPANKRFKLGVVFNF